MAAHVPSTADAWPEQGQSYGVRSMPLATDRPLPAPRLPFRPSHTHKRRRHGDAAWSSTSFWHSVLRTGGHASYGDNLAVIRFGAVTGPLRRPGMHGLIVPVLAEAEAAGWALDWRAVRCRLNTAADEVATEAVHEAGLLASEGPFLPVLRVERFP